MGNRSRSSRPALRSTFLAILTLVTLGSAVIRADDNPSDPARFESRIRPLLLKTCFRCHGDGKSSGEFRVDSREALLKGGETGPAIVPGRAAESLLIQAVRRSGDVSAMPPDETLPAEDVAAIAAWIDAGAPWPATAPAFEQTRHWAFEPLQAGGPPTVRNLEWVRDDLDAFVLAKQEAAGLEPGAAADRRTFLRRATFDLTGLPPTPAELEAFERDDSPQAFEAVVDRLLASPRYGEHWGRHWLDVVRYADTAGENSDHPLPHAWRYRNWVIQSLNADKPYDEFVREQIAGDLIAPTRPPEQYADCVVATGYLAIARRFGHDIEKDMHLTYEDTIDTLSKSILGLSVGCARCHDHKYDPITARDYYGLYGILESTRFAFPGCEPKQQPRDLVPLISPAEMDARVRPLQEQMSALESQQKSASESLPADARRLKEAAGQGSRLLSSGEVADGTGRELTSAHDSALGSVAVAKGDVLLLTIGARGNHGADSTLVELSIRETREGGRQWSVADLIDDLTRTNPQAAAESPPMWCFLDARDGLNYLAERVDQVNGRSEIRAWRNGDTPSVFVNASKDPVAVWTTLPARSFFAHPGPEGPVAIAWIAPDQATVEIQGRIADAHPGGDGVDWKLEYCPSEELAKGLTALGEKSQTLRNLAAKRDELSKSLTYPVAYAVAEGQPHNTRLQKRGEPTDLGDEVPRKFLDVLGGEVVPAAESSGRLELANWLTRPSNPLTPRVIVNRVWQWHFGRGLVATPNDFGTRGTPPTHPELLDFLAGEFIRSGWSLKTLHRRILLSATYRLGSRSQSEAPPPADLYVSFPRRRLTAEELRDTLLLVSGELDQTAGEAHPFPPESTWSFTQHAPFAAEYPTRKRSVYQLQKRNRRDRFFALFDGPDPNASTPVRDVTTVPTQALYFLNDPFVHDRAAAFANRILAAGADDRSRLEFAFRELTGRPAADGDVDDFRAFVRDISGSEAVTPEQAWTAYARIMIGSNEFLYVD